MGKAWGPALAGSFLLLAALAPVATAGNDDCYRGYLTVSRDIGYAFEVCPDGPGGLDPAAAGGLVPVRRGGDSGDGGEESDGDDGDNAPALPTPAWILPGQIVNNCEIDMEGKELKLAGYTVFLCWRYDLDLPSPGKVVDHVAPGPDEGPASPSDGGGGGGGNELVSCPAGTMGKAVRRHDSYVGACILFDYRVPRSLEGRIFMDATSCEMPAGNGVDPVIEVFDGYVVFCVYPWVDLHPDLPSGPMPGPGPVDGDVPVEVDVSPCSTRGQDPAVYAWDGYIVICLEAGYE